MSNHHITAAARPLELYETVDGITRKVSLQMLPLSDCDISELDLWVQTKYIRMARAAAADIPVEQRNNEIEIAQRTAAGMSAFTGAGARMIASVDGMARVVWQSTHKRHPDITEARIRELLFNPTNMDEANAVFAAANFQQPPDKKPGEKRGRALSRKELQKRLRRQVKG